MLQAYYQLVSFFFCYDSRKLNFYNKVQTFIWMIPQTCWYKKKKFLIWISMWSIAYQSLMQLSIMSEHKISICYKMCYLQDFHFSTMHKYVAYNQFTYHLWTEYICVFNICNTKWIKTLPEGFQMLSLLASVRQQQIYNVILVFYHPQFIQHSG